MSSRVCCPMCVGKKVFHLRTFFSTPKGDIVPHKVKKLCPICKGQGFLIVEHKIRLK